MNKSQDRKEANMELTAEARAAKNEYMRQWRAKNKDRVRAINQRYWERRVTKREEGKPDHAKASQ